MPLTSRTVLITFYPYIKAFIWFFIHFDLQTKKHDLPPIIVSPKRSVRGCLWKLPLLSWVLPVFERKWVLLAWTRLKLQAEHKLIPTDCRTLILTHKQGHLFWKKLHFKLKCHLVCSLQWFSSLDKYTILSSNACAHHDSCWGGQTKGAGARNGQHCYTDLKGKGEHKLCPVILAGLWRKKQHGLDKRLSESFYCVGLD